MDHILPSIVLHNFVLLDGEDCPVSKTLRSCNERTRGVIFTVRFCLFHVLFTQGLTMDEAAEDPSEEEQGQHRRPVLRRGVWSQSGLA